MAQQTELEIARREVTGKATKHLRRAGIIPANIYGHKEASQAVQIDAVAFDRLRRSHGTRNIVSLRLPDAAAQTALVRHIQHDARTGEVLHVDFFRVGVDERLNVKVPLRFVGESIAVKNEGGVLLHLVEALEVECRASDIVEGIDVDISPLTELDATLHARDVQLPANYTLVTDPDEPIAKVNATRAEAAEEAAEGATSPSPAEPTTTE